MLQQTPPHWKCLQLCGPGGKVALQAEVVGPRLGEAAALWVGAVSCAAVLAAVVLPLLVAACATPRLTGMPAGVLLPCVPQQGLACSSAADSGTHGQHACSAHTVQMWCAHSLSGTLRPAADSGRLTHVEHAHLDCILAASGILAVVSAQRAEAALLEASGADDVMDVRLEEALAQRALSAQLRPAADARHAELMQAVEHHGLAFVLDVRQACMVANSVLLLCRCILDGTFWIDIRADVRQTRQCSGMLTHIWGKAALRPHPHWGWLPWGFLTLCAEACSFRRRYCSSTAAVVPFSGC